MRERDFFEIGQRLQRILRRLRGDVVADAILWIEPEGRTGLVAAAGRDQQAAGDIPLCQADVLGLGAIHIDEKVRVVKGLLDVRIRCARQTAGASLSPGRP